MADQMQAIKRRMKSVSNTERITNAMKLVSAARIKQATNRFIYTKKNLSQVSEQINCAITAGEAPKIYWQERNGRTLYLLLTGSKGLCGGYNSAVIKEAEQIVKSKKDSCFLPLGTKARDFIERAELEKFELKDDKENLSKMMNIPVDEWNYIKIRKICKQIIDQYKYGEITKVVLLSTLYLNSLSYEVTQTMLLPVTKNHNGNIMEGGWDSVEYDSNEAGFFDYMAEEHLALQIYSAIAEATLCEYSSRRMAMKNASDNAKQMLTELSVYYNRARQAVITNEIIEIAAGAEALNKVK